jgi:hypothetical protein
VKQIVIGLGHRARAGKDEAAKVLVERFGFRRYAFADLLKHSVNLVMGWDERHATGALKEVVDPFWGVTPRFAYQRLGTEGYRRHISEDVWAKATRRLIESEGHERVVLTDVRFYKGEVETIQDMGGEVWHVHRPSLGPLNEDAHASERDLVCFTGWSATLVNDSTLAVFRDRVAHLCQLRGF